MSRTKKKTRKTDAKTKEALTPKVTQEGQSYLKIEKRRRARISKLEAELLALVDNSYSDRKQVLVRIPQRLWLIASARSKVEGMTFSGWVTKAIREAL